MQVNLDQVSPVVSVDVLGRSLGRALKVELDKDPGSQVAQDLLGDTFHSLYRQNPLLQPEQIPVERQANSAVQNWFRNTPAWGSLTEQTSGSLPATLAGLEAAWRGLQTDEAMQEAMKKAEDAEHQQQEADKLEFQANASESGGDQPSAESFRRQAQQYRDRAQALNQQAAQQVEAMQRNAMSKAMMGKAIKDAAKDAQEVNTIMSGYGLGAGSKVTADPKEALKFLKSMSDKIKQIAKLAGRARMIAGRSKSQSVVIKGRTPKGFTYTTNPDQIEISELALLHPNADPALRLLKIAQYADQGLLGRKRIGRPNGQGPFVAAIDGSGSMSGLPEIFAKGLALGLAQHAAADNRPYHLFTFSSAGDEYFTCTSNDNWAEHLKWAEMSQRGGTDFDKPLIDAMTYLKTLPSMQNADLLFISDGYARVGAETRQMWTEFSEQTGTRLLLLAVGYTPIDDLAKLANKVISVDSILDSFDDIAAQVGSW